MDHSFSMYHGEKNVIFSENFCEHTEWIISKSKEQNLRDSFFTPSFKKYKMVYVLNR